MDMKKAAQRGNETAAGLCESLMETLGTGPHYLCAVTAAATSLMFHVYRLGKHENKAQEILQAALNDVVHNIEQLDGEKIEIVVRRRA